MPITGRACNPSGFAVVHVMFQSKCTSFALTVGAAERMASDETKSERNIATVTSSSISLLHTLALMKKDELDQLVTGSSYICWPFSVLQGSDQIKNAAIPQQATILPEIPSSL